jgi:hypothetical protein
MVGVVQVSPTDGEQNAQNNSEKDAHDEIPPFPTSNAVDKDAVPAFRGGLEGDFDNKSDDFGPLNINRTSGAAVL